MSSSEKKEKKLEMYSFSAGLQAEQVHEVLLAQSPRLFLVHLHEHAQQNLALVQVQSPPNSELRHHEVALVVEVGILPLPHEEEVGQRVLDGGNPELLRHVRPHVAGVQVSVGLLLLVRHVRVENDHLHAVVELEEAPNERHVGAVLAGVRGVVVGGRIGEEERRDWLPAGERALLELHELGAVAGRGLRENANSGKPGVLRANFQSLNHLHAREGARSG